MNRRIEKQKRWLEERSDRAELIEWLRNQRGNFLRNMLESFNGWGCLTERQEDAVRKIRADREARGAESQHIGSVGERSVFTLIFKNVTGYDTDYGTAWLHKFTDQSGNIVTYKGTKHLEAERGAIVKIKATVKRHDELKGVKRTILSRPMRVED